MMLKIVFNGRILDKKKSQDFQGAVKAWMKTNVHKFEVNALSTMIGSMLTKYRPYSHFLPPYFLEMGSFHISECVKS